MLAEAERLQFGVYQGASGCMHLDNLVRNMVRGIMMIGLQLFATLNSLIHIPDVHVLNTELLKFVMH